MKAEIEKGECEWEAPDKGQCLLGLLGETRTRTGASCATATAPRGGLGIGGFSPRLCVLRNVFLNRFLRGGVSLVGVHPI